MKVNFLYLLMVAILKCMYSKQINSNDVSDCFKSGSCIYPSGHCSDLFKTDQRVGFFSLNRHLSSASLGSF